MSPGPSRNVRACGRVKQSGGGRVNALQSAAGSSPALTTKNNRLVLTLTLNKYCNG